MQADEEEDRLRARLATLLEVECVADLDLDQAMGVAGELIDTGSDVRDAAGPRAALGHLAEIQEREMHPGMRAQVFYFEGNAWSALDLLEKRGSESAWAWDRIEVERTLLAYRSAVRHQGFGAIERAQQSRILTNLGNALDTVGRFVAAANTYRLAAETDPSLGMPRANRGISLWHYARQHYDPGHQGVLAWHAYDQMRRSLELPLELGAKEGVLRVMKEIRQVAGEDFLEKPLQLEDFPLGDTEEELRYRRWCLSNRLFLNAMNDCFEESVSATDVLHLPNMVLPIGEGPGFHGFFNQLKQEYVSARYLLYESRQGGDPHYSDRDVKLVNTLDYPSYGLAVEKARWSYRSAASVLDKIAVFLAWYLELPRAKRATFLTVWYQKGKPQIGLRPEFEAMANWPLRGLFWMSKDLYDTASCGELLDPDAALLRGIRNNLEHQYVKLVEYGPHEGEAGGLEDRRAEMVGRMDFENLALRYLQHAREAMIYLSLGINADQAKKAAEAEAEGDKRITPPMFLTDFEDDWKQ